MHRAAFAAAFLLISGAAHAGGLRTVTPEMIADVAQAHGVPTRLARGIVRVESHYRCNVKNPGSTALGPMQLVRGTARQVGVPYRRLTDCATGLLAGMRYLKLALAKAGGEWCTAAALYERGIHAKLAPEPSLYCRKVLRHGWVVTALDRA